LILVLFLPKKKGFLVQVSILKNWDLGSSGFLFSKNSLVFNLAPSVTNLQQGSKGEKRTSFARAPNVYGL